MVLKLTAMLKIIYVFLLLEINKIFVISYLEKNHSMSSRGRKLDKNAIFLGGSLGMPASKSIKY